MVPGLPPPVVRVGEALSTVWHRDGARVKTLAGDLILPGDFAVVHLADPVAKLITVGERLNGDAFAQYQHAFFYAGGPQDLILEAEPGGARLVPYHYDPADVLWSTINPELALTKAQQADVLDIAKRYQNVPYSFLDYGALAAHRLHIWAPGLKHYVASTKHMICSQLVDQCRLDLGSHLFSDKRWPGYVTPAALAGLING